MQGKRQLKQRRRRAQPRQKGQEVPPPVADTIAYHPRPLDTFTMVTSKTYPVVSSTLGVGKLDINCYTVPLGVDPAATFGYYFNTRMVTKIIVDYVPKGDIDPADLMVYACVTPSYTLDDPSDSVVPLNYPDVRVWRPDSKYSFTIYPARLLKSMGLPHKSSYDAMSSYVAPILRIGIIKGTTAVTYGTVCLTATITFQGSHS